MAAFLFRLIKDNSAKNNLFTNHWEKCNLVGQFFLLGLFLSVPASFLNTVQRYLVVEFAMKPQFRLRIRITILLLLINWFAAIFFIIFVLKLNYFDSKSRLRLIANLNPAKRVFSLTVFYVGGGLLQYLATVVMYARIYIIFRKSSLQVGIKRQASHTNRIASLVLTNILFLFLPIAFVALRGAFHFAHNRHQTTVPGVSYERIAN